MKDLTSDIKFLQVSKLIRNIKPVTINGIPTKTIVSQIKQKEEKDPDCFKVYKNHARLSYLQKYLLEYMRNDPKGSIFISFTINTQSIEKLKLNLTVPSEFPKNKQHKPKIKVLNEDISSSQIELGFKEIVDIAQGKKSDNMELVEGPGLYSMILTLAKYLQSFMSKSTEKPNEKIDKIQRDIYLEEIYRLNPKLFKKSQSENVYKLSLPIFQGPELYRINKNLDILIKVPISYPNSPLDISLPNNFNSNLILKHYSNKEQFELVQITKEYRNIERHLNFNFKTFNFDTSSILQIMNYLANNIDKFLLDKKNFAQWMKLSNKMVRSDQLNV